jgi:hypothetical protein
VAQRRRLDPHSVTAALDARADLLDGLLMTQSIFVEAPTSVDLKIRGPEGAAIAYLEPHHLRVKLTIGHVWEGRGCSMRFRERVISRRPIALSHLPRREQKYTAKSLTARGRRKALGSAADVSYQSWRITLCVPVLPVAHCARVVVPV